MSFLGRKPADAIATTADIADGVVTAAKLAGDFDDNIQTNIAMLAFRTAVNGSGLKFNLQDQVIDEYGTASTPDATGINATPSTNHILTAGASTNETLTAGVYSGGAVAPPTGGDSTDTSVSGYTTLVFTTSRALTVVDGGNVSILVVAGGGSGGTEYGGGGGAGGLVYKASYAVTANTYDIVRGAGGTGGTHSAPYEGTAGGDTTFTINGGALQFIAKGGGKGGSEVSPVSSATDLQGGSGGGAAWNETKGDDTQSSQSGESGSLGFGFEGGSGQGSTGYNSGGGGGAGSAGGNATNSVSGNGGTGKDYSAIFGTAVGDSGWFASGGGGGFTSNGAGAAGTASNGGGTTGGVSNGSSTSAAQANTGGGSGGASSAGAASQTSGLGGSGVVLVRYTNTDFTAAYNDITLQSIDTTAEAVPTKADMVMLMEDTAGTATLNTDIKGLVSRDSGATFTEGVLVDEGDWGTNKRILAFHDLSFTSSTGQAMCYKITTHNQAVGKQTKIHATSIGWR